MKKRGTGFWIACGVGGGLFVVVLVFVFILGLMYRIYEHGMSVNERIIETWEEQTDRILGDTWDEQSVSGDETEFQGGLPKESTFSFQGVDSLEVEVENASVTILTHQENRVLVDRSGVNSPRKLSCSQDNGELEIDLENQAMSSEESLVIYLPQDLMLREVSVEVDGKYFEMNQITAAELEAYMSEWAVQ